MCGGCEFKCVWCKIVCGWWGLGERGADLCVEDVSLRVRGVRLCVRGGVWVSVVRVYVGVVCFG